MQENEISLLEFIDIVSLPFGKNYNLEQEQALHIAIAQHLTHLTIEKKLKALWFHPNNNFIAQNDKKHFVFYNKLKQMGHRAGMPDLVFMYKDGCAFLEVKTIKGKLSDKQKQIKRWADCLGINYEIVRTIEEVEQALIKFGCLTL